jgi:hypothetical protein
MSETPVPDFRREFDDEGAVVGELLARRKSQSGRPVSAFGSASTLVKADTPTAQAGDAGESGLVAGLQAAGMLRELSLSELDRITRGLAHDSEAVARRLSLLEGYYSAGSDAVSALRRRATDRWFMFHQGDAVGAPQLVQRLLGVLPEIAGAHLERVGTGTLGTLVLRQGEHVCAIDDDNMSRDGTVSVQEIVRALNVLLDRKGVRARLVGLLSDGAREAYLGLPSLSSALSLVEADYLTAPDVETLMGLTAW